MVFDKKKEYLLLAIRHHLKKRLIISIFVYLVLPFIYFGLL